MARNRQNLNIIYISDRMRETLRPIASCALTAVVAPMGYGKTTAVRWFLAEQAKAGAVALQASIYSDNRSIFWKSVQKAFAAAGLTVLEPAAAGVGHLRHVHRRHAGVPARKDPGLPRCDGAGR